MASIPNSTEAERRPPQSPQFHTVKLADLRHHVWDLSPQSLSCRFRLLDCRSFLERNELTIHCWEELPDVPYSAISYPWLGVSCRNPPKATITVAHKPGSRGDPISVEMLRLACSLSVRDGAGFLWMDRLCIVQTDSEDVRWNLQRMARAYRSCKQCLVFPGGLRRLASIHEPTGYNERPWTLQEALLPSRALVVFSSPSLKLPYLPIRFAYTTLRSGAYAVSCGLHHLLQKARANESIRLFGDATTASAAHLLDALTRKHSAISWEEQYALYRSVWQSAMLRKYRDPKDLFLCTMEVLGIRLKEDRSPGAILDAFLKAIQPQGLMDPRFVALARVVLASRDASPEWCSTYLHILNSLTPEPPLSMYALAHLIHPRLEGEEKIMELRLGTILSVQDILPSVQPFELHRIRVGAASSPDLLFKIEGCRADCVKVLPSDLMKKGVVRAAYRKIPIRCIPTEAVIGLNEHRNRAGLFHLSIFAYIDNDAHSVQLFVKLKATPRICCFRYDTFEERVYATGMMSGAAFND